VELAQINFHKITKFCESAVTSKTYKFGLVLNSILL
jgi:hypothetical protein